MMSKIVFYFDENLSPNVARALDAYEFGRGNDRVLNTREAIKGGISDQAILDYINKQDHFSVIITADRDFRKRELYTQIWENPKLGLFYIEFPRGSKSHKRFSFIVDQWDEIKNKSISTACPFAFVITSKGKILKI